MTRLFKTGALLILLINPIHTLAEGTGNATGESSQRTNEVLHRHKICSITTILILNTISICIPILGNKVPELRPGTNGFTMIKAFAGSAVLSTGLALVLPASFSWNKNDILSFEFFAMIAAILILLVAVFGYSFYMSVSPLILSIAVYNILDKNWSNVMNIMPRLGMVHSLIIGITTGLSTDLNMVKLLLTALTFHQYCEGIGFGEFLVTFDQVFNPWAKRVMLYSTLLAAPLGVGIGICISRIFDDDRKNILKQIFDVGSVCILVCRAVVDLAALMYVTPSSEMLLFGARLLVLVGAGCMTLLAIWT